MRVYDWRFVWCVGAAAGMATSAPGQTATLTFGWRNTQTGIQEPLRPGQSADIWLDVEFDPPVGTVVPLGPVEGTIAGLGSVFIDLIGSAGAEGAWILGGPSFAGTPDPSGPGSNVNFTEYGRRVDVAGGWTLGGPGIPGGTVAGGTRRDLIGIQAGQFPMGVPANSFNPVAEIWRTQWQPDEYTLRTISFQSRLSHWTAVSLLVVRPDTSFAVLHVGSGNINWGTLQIGIVPAPAGSAALILGGLTMAWRRRSVQR